MARCKFNQGIKECSVHVTPADICLYCHSRFFPVDYVRSVSCNAERSCIVCESSSTAQRNTCIWVCEAHLRTMALESRGRTYWPSRWS